MQHNLSFTKVDNTFLDEIIRHTTTHGEIVCCMIIFRKTIGWGKENADISISTFQELGGISRRETIITSIKSLRKKGIIKTKKTTGKTTNFTLSYQYALSVPVRKNRTPALSVPVPVRMNRTHKRKERNIYEREGDVFISEEHKQKFIVFTMAQEDVKNPQGYELSMRKKLLKNDPATLEMFYNWQESNEKTKIFDEFCIRYIGKQLEVKIKDEVLSGEIQSITQEGGKFTVAIIDGDIHRSIKYRTLESIKKTIEVAA